MTKRDLGPLCSRPPFFVLGPLVAAAALAAPGHAQLGAQKVALLPDGTPSPEFSEEPDLSADGRFVAFVSFDSNLAPGEANNKEDAFVRDLLLGTTQRVAPGANERVSEPAISGDGRFVAFSSSTTSFGFLGPDEYQQIYRYDLVTGAVELVSANASGFMADGASGGPAISEDGRFVSFFSYAPDLVAGDNNMVADVFLRDVEFGTTERISLWSGGVQGNQHCYTSALSPDLRYVVFETRSTNIEPAQNNYRDLFLRDRVADTLDKVTFSWTGGPTDGRSEGPFDISADGRYIAFTSEADNLVPGQHDDVFPVRAVFVRDMQLGVNELISVDPTLPGAPELGDCFGASMSDDGRYVVFTCATDGGVYLRDRVLGSLLRVDRSDLGEAGNAAGRAAVISDDGAWLAFTSEATNLVAGDDNVAQDAYVRAWPRAGELSVASMVAGTQASVTLSGFAPSTFMLVGVAFGAGGATPFQLGGAAGLADLGSLALYFSGLTDGAGQLAVAGFLPPALAGQAIHVQGYDLFTSTLTPAFNGVVQ